MEMHFLLCFFEPVFFTFALFQCAAIKFKCCFWFSSDAAGQVARSVRRGYNLQLPQHPQISVRVPVRALLRQRRAQPQYARGVAAHAQWEAARGPCARPPRGAHQAYPRPTQCEHPPTYKPYVNVSPVRVSYIPILTHLARFCMHSSPPSGPLVKSKSPQSL